MQKSSQVRAKRSSLTLGKFVIDAGAWVARRRAGFANETVVVGGQTVHYLQGGSGPPLVLLHPLSSDRSSFVQAAGAVTSHRSVILPDLPGHGGCTRDPKGDYSIAAQARWVVSFLDALGLRTVDLGGNSYGGHVALSATIRSPERVRSLIVMSSAGLEVGLATGLDIYGGFGEPMRSVADLHAFLDRVFHLRPSMPSFVERQLMNDINANYDFLEAMIAMIRTGDDLRLNERIHEIRQPTLIVWGREDAVVPLSVGQGYAELIPNAELVVLDGAGHIPQLERSDAVGTAMTNFLVD